MRLSRFFTPLQLSLAVHLSFLLLLQLAYLQGQREIWRGAAPLLVDIVPSTHPAVEGPESPTKAAKAPGRLAEPPPQKVIPRRAARRPQVRPDPYLSELRRKLDARLAQLRAPRTMASAVPPPPVVESAPPDAAVIPAPADAESPPAPVLADLLPDTAPEDDDPDRVVEAYSRADGWETDLVGGPEEKGPGMVDQIGGWQDGGSRNYFVRRRVTTRISGQSRYGPNTPGYRGRLLGEVSVANGSGQKSYYGKIHLFPKDTRDFSQATLFGYSFRQDLGDNSVRHIEVGRAQTTGAYLMVTDLFRDARHSSMGHTVILAFPRDRTNAKGKLYWVDDEPGGRFRLNGPGFWLRFDGPTGALLQASGLSIRGQGAIKTPPRVYYPGIQVKIQAVGGNPFLRGRGATIADARGRECRVSTGDLFDYRGTKGESDMFRFDDDADFFDFVRRRCPGLTVPRVARRQVARSDSPKREASDGSSGGLIHMLMGR